MWRRDLWNSSSSSASCFLRLSSISDLLLSSLSWSCFSSSLQKLSPMAPFLLFAALLLLLLHMRQTRVCAFLFCPVLLCRGRGPPWSNGLRLSLRGPADLLLLPSQGLFEPADRLLPLVCWGLQLSFLHFSCSISSFSLHLSFPPAVSSVAPFDTMIKTNKTFYFFSLYWREKQQFSILVNEAEQTSSLVSTAYIAVFSLSCFLSVLLLLFAIIMGCTDCLMNQGTVRSELGKWGRVRF